MIKDTDKTKVVFRKYKDGSILALFPHERWDLTNFVSSYMHMGQHGGADYNGCIKDTKPAIQIEYKDLFNELEGIGYNLKVIKRRGSL